MKKLVLIFAALLPVISLMAMTSEVKGQEGNRDSVKSENFTPNTKNANKDFCEAKNTPSSDQGVKGGANAQAPKVMTPVSNEKAPSEVK